MKRKQRRRSHAERADSARASLLAAGMELFSRQGYEGVSIREIGRLAGQNSATITYYFDGKKKLYREVLRTVVAFVQQHSLPVAGEYQRLKAAGPGGLSLAAAEQLLRQFLRDMFTGVFSRSESAQRALLFVREQLQPTGIMPKSLLGEIGALHAMLTELIAAATGTAADDRRSILRAHTLYGQLQVFAMARALLLQRLNWSDLEGERCEQIVAVALENLEILLRGWRQTPVATSSARSSALSS